MRLHTAASYMLLSVLRGRLSSEGGWEMLLSVRKGVGWQTWFRAMGAPLAEPRRSVAVSMAGQRRGGHEGAAHRLLAVAWCGKSWVWGGVGVRNWDDGGDTAQPLVVTKKHDHAP